MSASRPADARSRDPRHRPARARAGVVDGRRAGAARRSARRVGRRGAAAAGPPAAGRAPARRPVDPARDGGRRRGRRAGRRRSAAARHRVRVVRRRRQQLPRAVRNAGRRRPPALADPLHELGPQRAGRLLAHRGRQPLGVDQPERVRRQLRGRPARGRDPGRRERRRRSCWSRSTCPTPSRCTGCGRCPARPASRWCWRRPTRPARSRGSRSSSSMRHEPGRSAACADAGLDALRSAIPAAAALPLLEAIARRSSEQALVLGYLPTLALRAVVRGAGLNR